MAQVLVDRRRSRRGREHGGPDVFGLGQRDVGSLRQDLELSYRPVST